MNILTAPALPDAATLAQPGATKMWKAAQAFEAMALGQLLAPMFATVDHGKSVFGGGAAESTWRPMMTQEMAKQVASHGGLGIAAPVFRQMLQMQEAAQKAREEAP
jgi:flagellar protein FlgJ